ncbi:hypothetical protein TNCT_397371 [Trichonephila clavata]|uniref:Uncharacterized protein n=1 Tax=Trichonephila clavata TaxID=2740835 RepID=A0A8X6FHP7_TRICU|nr:hypothetical protein TNCT_397371 [Trichonephila clavata]
MFSGFQPAAEDINNINQPRNIEPDFKSAARGSRLERAKAGEAFIIFIFRFSQNLHLVIVIIDIGIHQHHLIFDKSIKFKIKIKSDAFNPP